MLTTCCTDWITNGPRSPLTSCAETLPSHLRISSSRKWQSIPTRSSQCRDLRITPKTIACTWPSGQSCTKQSTMMTPTLKGIPKTRTSRTMSNPKWSYSKFKLPIASIALGHSLILPSLLSGTTKEKYTSWTSPKTSKNLKITSVLKKVKLAAKSSFNQTLKGSLSAGTSIR